MNRIVWATVAADDLREIVDHLRIDSLEAARSFVERVDSATKRLGTHPRIGRVVPELQRQNITRYREVILSPWRLFYRIEPDTIYVVSLLDGRRDVEEVLLRRLLR